MSNRGIKKLDKFSENPFQEKDFINSTDMEFMFSLSKSAQNIMRYMIYKKVYLEDKFLFDLDDFNKYIGYKSRGTYLSGVIDLINKDVLARTKLPNLYWINKKLLERLVFNNK